MNRIKAKLYSESVLAYIIIIYCQKNTNFKELSIAYDIKRDWNILSILLERLKNIGNQFFLTVELLGLKC